MAGSNHGHTPAAWTGVTISIIGFCVAGVFMVAADPLGVVAGLAIIPIGGLVGLGMRAAGLGGVKESDAAKQARVEAGLAALNRVEGDGRAEEHSAGQPQPSVQAKPEPASQTA